MTVAARDRFEILGGAGDSKGERGSTHQTRGWRGRDDLGVGWRFVELFYVTAGQVRAIIGRENVRVRATVANTSAPSDGVAVTLVDDVISLVLRVS
jgi:hypothetical protein